MEQCSKADPFNELLITALHKLGVDNHSLQEENKAWDIHLDNSKLYFEDILKIKTMDEELEDIAMLPGESPLDSSFEESSTTDDLNKPIFEASQITLATSILLTMTFALKYSLSGVALDLLTLISLHCSIPSLCKSSFTAFQRLFHDLSAPISMHKYC